MASELKCYECAVALSIGFECENFSSFRELFTNCAGAGLELDWRWSGTGLEVVWKWSGLATELKFLQVLGREKHRAFLLVIRPT